MHSKSGVGRTSFGDVARFNGVKVFSATMVSERDKLGDKVTDWLEENPKIDVREIGARTALRFSLRGS